MGAASQRERAFLAALGAIALGALALRLGPLLRAGGPLSYPVDYDEGVYFSAAALWAQGVLPYRDFAFVHPPGLLVVLRLASALSGAGDAAQAFALARCLAPLWGALNVALVGSLVRRQGGALAGLAAAALYATYPEAVGTERGVFLEPLLNLACLATALAWLRPTATLSPAAQRRTQLLAGLLFGVALATKATAAPWLLAVALSSPAPRRAAALARFAFAATAAALLLVGPLALASPGDFLDDVVRFHLGRPPDGDVDRWVRLAKLFGGRHLVAWAAAAAALLGLGVRAARGQAPTRAEAFFAAAWLLTLAGFLAAPAYWAQYNAHLAASECALAGLGLGRGFQALAARLPPRWHTAVASGVLLALAAPSTWRSLRAIAPPAPAQLLLGAELRQTVGPRDCVVAFEPGWGLLGGRLPAHGDGAPVVVDVYAVMLRRAAQGRRGADAAGAFAAGAAQPEMQARLQACRFAVLGWRGAWQLTGAARAWFDARFTPLAAPGLEGLEVWAQPPSR